jgi:CBS domain-containing protein
LSDLVTVQPDDHLVTVLDRLKDSPARRVLVLRGDQLAGIITPSDMALWLERAQQVQKP